MKRESVTADQLEGAVAGLRSEIDRRLDHTQDRLLTAVFGFVNGASSRMEALERADDELRNKIHALECRVGELEHGPGEAMK